MSKRQTSHNPILYVHQPNMKTPEAHMQNHSITRRESSTMKKRQTRKAIPYRRRLTRPEMTDNDIEMSPINTEESKSFQDMTINERLTYLSRNPKYTPKLRCEIIANEKKYRGIIQSFEDDTVVMIVQRRRVSLSVADIMHVEMLGLGRL
ncbi:MAG TPA: CotO family spore coat protein [Cerasibacillus sp.]|uniref:CotO family spore coat protein n=1 Tax=Cerasibacillus sp. TaxID=2498711 RepID=UPI002F3E82DD